MTFSETVSTNRPLLCGQIEAIESGLFLSFVAPFGLAGNTKSSPEAYLLDPDMLASINSGRTFVRQSGIRRASAMSAPDDGDATTVVIVREPGLVYVKIADPKPVRDRIEPNTSQNNRPLVQHFIHNS